MIENLIARYKEHFVVLHQLWEQIEETGVVPNTDIEGAPQTTQEAFYSISAMMFVLEQVINDLTIALMEANFTNTAERRD